MKLKRFLALVVSLAMVLSIVPAFSLTASATEIGDRVTINGRTYVINGENLITDGFNSFTRASDGKALGWQTVSKSSVDSSLSDGEFIHLTGGTTGGTGANTMRTFYPITGGKTYYVTNTIYNKTGKETTSSGSAGMAAIVATGKPVFNTFSGLTIYSHVNFGGYNSWSNESAPTFIGDKTGRWDITSKPGLNVVEAIITTPEDATHIMFSYGGWGNTNLYYGDFGIYEVRLPEDIQITVKYVENDNVVDSYITYISEDAEFTPPEYYACESNGYLYTTGTPQQSGNVVTVPVTKRNTLVEQRDGVYNSAENGSFENENGEFDTTGWIYTNSNDQIMDPTVDRGISNNTSDQDGSYNYFFAVSDENYYFRGVQYDIGEICLTGWGSADVYPLKGSPADGNWYLMGKWDDGYAALCGTKRSFPLTPGKSYVLQYDVKTNDELVKTDGNSIITYTTADANDLNESAALAIAQKAGTLSNDWKTVSHFVDATDSNDYIWMRAYNFQNICIDNVRLYEIDVLAESNPATVQGAIDTVTAPTMTKGTLELATTVNDGVTDLDVKWNSSNEEIIANDGTLNLPSQVTKVDVTPYVEWEGDKYTGKTTTVTVFPAPLAGTLYKADDGVYSVGETMISLDTITIASDKKTTLPNSQWKKNHY